MAERNREDDRSESSDYSSEDEGTDDYRRGGYHAARIGDSFMSGRYIVQAKLGWGNFSTVWLAWDVQQSRYVALKVQKSAVHFTEAAMEEISILKQIADGDQDDSKCVVKLLDHFKHSGPNGQHVCMVFEYLGDNLLKLVKYTDYRGLPLHMVKEICFHILVGLDYLHSKLSLIHTDLKPENILLMSTIDPSKDPRKSGNPPILDRVGIEVKALNGDLTRIQNKKIRRKAKRAAQGCAGKGVSSELDAKLERFGARDLSNNANSNADSVKCHPRGSNNGSSEADETKGGGSENQGDRRASRSTRKKLLASIDQRCKLVDFGNACWTYKQVTDDIQTRQYKCPEVILGSKYSTPADLWSFACICFELATGDVLFDPQGSDNFDMDVGHLALMMELLGTMPRKVALGGRNSRDYFNKYGDLQHVRRLRFWPMNKVLKEKYEFTEQEANGLTEFLVPILDFNPQARPTAAQLLVHPWMNAGPRLLEPSISPSDDNKKASDIVADKNPKRGSEREREAAEVKLGGLAIGSKTKPVVKGVSTSGRLF